ncbi:MAG: cation-translocating P-type ATPase [Kofleriaceae bacterium]
MTTAIATEALARIGRNELPEPERRRLPAVIASVLGEPMVLLLVIATALYVVLGSMTEAVALAISVIVIVTITIMQERRTERTLDALRELASPQVQVMRDGAWSRLDARLLVPRDIIQIEEGDRIPADAVVRFGTPVAVDESLLTGESVPVVREHGATVHAGTLVTSGHAVAEVIRTGGSTEMGRIGGSLNAIDVARAPLQLEVRRVVRRVAVIALACSAVLALIHVIAGHGLVVALLAAITLAMSLLPEELPLVLAVFLTFGAWRIAKQRVLARRGAAIETLGAVTVLCVDKTGTLTGNRMEIRRIWTTRDVTIEPHASELPEEAHPAVEYGLLACRSQSSDPTDRAFSILADRALAMTEHVHPRWQWLREYPLAPGLLAVTHAWRGDGNRDVIATKGAPEAIFQLCRLGRDALQSWRARAEALAAGGLRVLGIARADHTGNLEKAANEYAFELIGLVGLEDPLRPETSETIATCHRAGIRVVMITGDHPTTAAALGRAAGLAVDEILTGPMLEQLEPDALATALRRVEVIARAAPAHKLRIVQVLRAGGEVVGMTGDGVNDAPALKAADVGIAMGRGTDIAREAAGLVLLDDALSAIVAAIATGRTIYTNLRKVSAYLLAVHVPIAALSLLLPLLGWPVLLGPIHIVFFELVVDPTCSLVFEQEPASPDVMTTPPRGRGTQLFEARRVIHAIGLGVAAFLGAFAVVVLEHAAGAPAEIMRALGFVALIAADLCLALVVRRGTGASTRNRAMTWMSAAVCGTLVVVLAVPSARHLFGFGSPSIPQIVLAIASGVLPVLVIDMVSNDGGSRRLRA